MKNSCAPVVGAVAHALVGTFALAVLLAGCGGGGGSSPTPVPTLSSSIASGTGSSQFVEGTSGALAFTVTTTGSQAGAIVPVVQVDQSSVLTMVGGVDTSVPNQYTVHLTTAVGLAPGTYSGQVVFQLCSDASCSTSYAAGKQAFSYTVDVLLSDWQTFQRNAAHNGFVNAQLDPTKFTQAWTWSRPAGDSEPIGGINAVATTAGKVIVTKDIYFGQGAVYALSETDGSTVWTYALGTMSSEGPAAVDNGLVSVPTTDSSENCVMWAIDAATGTYQFKMASTCQWSNFFAPTPTGAGDMLQTSEAGSVYSFSGTDGTPQWEAGAGAFDQTTPAVDQQYVYQYGYNLSGGVMNVFDRLTGASVAAIQDPFTTSSAYYTLFSAPMLGTQGDVLSFSGSGFSGRAASSSEQYESRVLVSYSIASRTSAWRSSNMYLTHPAVANGVVYAARNSPASFDALSETDGHILWSWTPSASGATFHRNILVTRNLVFVSTDTNVVAIDLATHQQVWQYPKPGMLAISGSSMLYIVTGASISDGHLVAIKLK